MKTQRAAVSDKLILLEELAYDDFELGLLAVLRHFSKSYEMPERQTWQHAYMIAAERWGERIGLSTAYALMKVIQAVSRCRVNGLCVQDPLCPDAKIYATLDEEAFISMLHYMRRDETQRARISISHWHLVDMILQLSMRGSHLRTDFLWGREN